MNIIITALRILITLICTYGIYRWIKYVLKNCKKFKFSDKLYLGCLLLIYIYGILFNATYFMGV